MFEVFKDRLKKVRTDNNVTLQSLADSIGLSAGVVGHYEKGRTKPSLESIISIADYFNVSIDYLLGRDSDNYKNELTLKKNCGELIKKLRDENNYTRKTLIFMLKAKIKEEDLEKIESGEVSPDIKLIGEIAYIFKVPMSHFFDPGKITNKEILDFVNDPENLEYIRLAMRVKERGLNPNEVIFGFKP